MEPSHEIPSDQLHQAISQAIEGLLQEENRQIATRLKSVLEEKEDILESIGDAFFSVDKQWIIRYWNRMAEANLGVKREELLGKNLWECFPAAVELDFYPQYHLAMETGQRVNFQTFYPITGRWYEIEAFPSNRGLSVYFRDISDQRAAAEAVRLSNERFEKVAQATRDAIWDWDVAQNTLYWGEGFRTLFGYEVGNNSHNFQAWFANIHPEDAEQVQQRVTHVMGSPESQTFNNSYRFQKANGQYAFVMDRGIVMRDEGGQPIRLIGAMSDMTEQRQYEENLRTLNAQLEQHSKELAQSNAELEQFAYIASHDLQEPLRMVSSFLAQLEKKYSHLLDDRARQYIFFAVDGAKRMRQIVLDLLEFSRVGKQIEPKSRVALMALMQEVLHLFHGAIQEKKAVIRYAGLPEVMAHRGPLLQVLQNLIGNALKYQREGIRPEIDVQCTEGHTEWVVSVADNGIGIEAEYFQKVFVIFQRLHSKQAYEGSGIGLAIVKKIIETLGGRVWVESEVGKGSTFFFSIPKQEN